MSTTLGFCIDTDHRTITFCQPWTQIMRSCHGSGASRNTKSGITARVRLILHNVCKKCSDSGFIVGLKNIYIILPCLIWSNVLLLTSPVIVTRFFSGQVFILPSRLLRSALLGNNSFFAVCPISGPLCVCMYTLIANGSVLSIVHV